MATAFDNEESLTPEEILHRFKKVMGRDMTPAERHKFFLPAEPSSRTLEKQCREELSRDATRA
jgi:hypothetical protein